MSDDFDDAMGMSSSPIMPEQLAGSPPEFRALLAAVIAYYEARTAVGALAALLMGCLRQSKSRTALFLSTVLLSPGREWLRSLAEPRVYPLK